jgi:DNA-binding NtrC family response regulator
MLERITYLMPNNTITVNDLPIDVQQPLDYPVRLEETEPPSTAISSKNGALKEQSVNAEVQAIISALLAGDGHAARAAALLGISRTTLWRKMVKYGLIEDRHKS